MSSPSPHSQRALIRSPDYHHCGDALIPRAVPSGLLLRTQNLNASTPRARDQPSSADASDAVSSATPTPHSLAASMLRPAVGKVRMLRFVITAIA
eukprot:gene6293-5062_t